MVRNYIRKTNRASYSDTAVHTAMKFVTDGHSLNAKFYLVEFYNEGICALVKRRFGKRKITSRSNYEMLML